MRALAQPREHERRRHGIEHGDASDGCQWIFGHEPERYSKAVGLDRVLTGKDVPEIRAHMRLSGKLGGVLEE